MQRPHGKAACDVFVPFTALFTALFTAPFTAPCTRGAGANWANWGHGTCSATGWTADDAPRKAFSFVTLAVAGGHATGKALLPWCAAWASCLPLA